MGSCRSHTVGKPLLLPLLKTLRRLLLPARLKSPRYRSVRELPAKGEEEATSQIGRKYLRSQNKKQCDAQFRIFDLRRSLPSSELGKCLTPWFQWFVDLFAGSPLLRTRRS